MIVSLYWHVLKDRRVSIIAIRETTRDLRERVLDFTRYKPISLGLSSTHVRCV